MLNVDNYSKCSISDKEEYSIKVFLQNDYKRLIIIRIT